MDELISRQAANCLIDKWKEAFIESRHLESAGDIILVKNDLNDLPSVQSEQKWIPCKERLPESDYETVLVAGKMKYAFEKEYEYFVDCAFVGSIHGTPNNFNPFDFETWNDWYEGQDEYYILAWMPLPEPYKDGGE